MQVDVDKYPQLRMLCWNRGEQACIDGEEAFALYERNWRFVDADALNAEEKALLAELVDLHGPLLIPN